MKKPARSGGVSAPAANGDPAQGEVLTLAEAAVYLRMPEPDVLRLVAEQALPGRRLGNEWRFLKTAIQQWLSTTPAKENKEAWMGLAGAWKNDPFVEEELREIYRRRGRPMTLPMTGGRK
jgi:excisionase family DNA binding protein